MIARAFTYIDLPPKVSPLVWCGLNEPEPSPASVPTPVGSKPGARIGSGDDRQQSARGPQS
ncbi:hypothetical protein C3941_00785 [Kaistia algarum]|nr:hypothetical protein C3941_00785 [Kaistia algarum]